MLPESKPAESLRASSPGARRRLPRQPGGWLRLSISRRWLLALSTLLGLVCLLFVEENWRGRRAWDTCQRELKAKGAELDWQRFVPPPVPDDQNFALTPFLAPLFDLNPQPREPGQSPWRDVAGHERAASFAAVLLPIDKQGQIPAARFAGRMTDLEGAFLLLRTQTNRSSAPAPAFASRVETAAAVLAALQEYAPVLEELRLASRRPRSRFNIEYGADDPFRILLPHYLVLQRVSRVLELRASAELAQHLPAAAFEDVTLMRYLADSIRGEPFLVGVGARGSLLKRTEQIIWEGLAGRNWTEPQLAELQAGLKSCQLLRELETSLQAERAAFGEKAFRHLRSHKNVLRNWIAASEDAGPLVYLLAGPSGWLYQEQTSYWRLFEERVSSGFEPGAGRFHPRVIDANQKALEQELQRSPLWHHTGFARLILGHTLKTLERAAVGQNRLDQTVLACALERYRLAEGAYPATLEALVPQFLEQVPVDVCDGRPLRYRRLEPGRFQLYSVGWNEADEGGLVVLKPDGSDFDPDRGDWVWPPYPQH